MLLAGVGRMNAGVMDVERILAGRTLRRIGRSITLLDSTASTNDHVWSIADNGAGDGYVVFTEHQSAGRGRMGRSWVSPRGASIMCSMLLIDSADLPVPTADTLGLIVGIATANAIVQATGISALVDWPNDIVIRDRKVAGILVESRPLASGRRGFVVGIGINCLQHRHHFPAELRSQATSLDLESSVAVDRESVAGSLLSSLDQWLCDPSRWGAQEVRSAFMASTIRLGRPIRLRYQGREYSGQVVDIDPSAALVVQLDVGGRRLFPAAGTSVIRSA